MKKRKKEISFRNVATFSLPRGRERYFFFFLSLVLSIFFFLGGGRGPSGGNREVENKKMLESGRVFERISFSRHGVLAREA